MLVLHFTFFIFSMMLKYEVSIKTIEEIFKKERGDIIPPLFDIFTPHEGDKNVTPNSIKIKTD